MYLLGTAIGYIILPPPKISAGCGSGGDSRIKNVWGHCRAKEKAGGNINVSSARWLFLRLICYD